MSFCICDSQYGDVTLVPGQLQASTEIVELGSNSYFCISNRSTAWVNADLIAYSPDMGSSYSVLTLVVPPYETVCSNDPDVDAVSPVDRQSLYFPPGLYRLQLTTGPNAVGMLDAFAFGQFYATTVNQIDLRHG